MLKEATVSVYLTSHIFQTIVLFNYVTIEFRKIPNIGPRAISEERSILVGVYSDGPTSRWA